MKTCLRICLISIFLVLFSCKKEKIARGTPACIKNKIEAFGRNCCNDARVEEYTFQGEEVYVFEAGGCGADMTSEVVNEQCGTLGFLGGIAGNTKISGADFNQAVFIRTTWKK